MSRVLASDTTETDTCPHCGRAVGQEHAQGCRLDRAGGTPRVPGLPSRIRTLRTTDAEWGRYTRAAQREGLSRSEWIRRTLDAAAGT